MLTTVISNSVNPLQNSQCSVFPSVGHLYTLPWLDFFNPGIKASSLTQIGLYFKSTQQYNCFLVLIFKIVLKYTNKEIIKLCTKFPFSNKLRVFYIISYCIFDHDNMSKHFKVKRYVLYMLFVCLFVCLQIVFN